MSGSEKNSMQKKEAEDKSPTLSLPLHPSPFWMQREIKRDDQQDETAFCKCFSHASFPPVRNHCLIKCHLASIQPQKVAVAVEFLSGLRVSPLSKKQKERNDRRAV